jgi:hypothetical protein
MKIRNTVELVMVFILILVMVTPSWRCAQA